MTLFTIIVGATFFTGCLSVGTQYQDGLRVRTVGDTNWLRPSLSFMQVEECVESSGVKHVVIDKEGGDVSKQVCHGTYRPVAQVQGTQAGAATGIFGAMVQGGAIVGGAYLLGDGIRDSADKTSLSSNQEGGGASANAKAKAKGGNAKAKATGGNARAKASAKQKQGQSQRQYQRQNQMGAD